MKRLLVMLLGLCTCLMVYSSTLIFYFDLTEYRKVYEKPYLMRVYDDSGTGYFSVEMNSYHDVELRINSNYMWTYETFDDDDLIDLDKDGDKIECYYKKGGIVYHIEINKYLKRVIISKESKGLLQVVHGKLTAINNI